ncbi:MAG TPA: cyclic peptide export ABC transporter [Thermoanaerobaculia bacterium]
MKLIALLRQESTVSLRRLCVLAALAGLSSALVLPIINTAARLASHRESSFRLLLLFLLIVTIYAISQRVFMVEAIAEVEVVLDRVRTRLVDKIRRCDLGPLEEIGRTMIYASISKDTTTISQASLVLVMSAQFSILLFFTALYVLVLSPLAFLLTGLCTVAIVIGYRSRILKIMAQMAQSARKENELFDTLTHMLEGFKEVRLNRARSDALFRRFTEVSRSVAELKSTSMAKISTTFVLSQVWFYLLLGVIVFVVPRLSLTFTEQVMAVTTAVLFMVGPITSLVGAAQNLAGADAAVGNIAAIEQILDKSLSPFVDEVQPWSKFRTITFDDVVFHYGNEDGGTFTVGPIDLTIHAGETLFIAGGNGSGKSTLLKLITALYFPSRGTIRIDGKELTPDRYDSYRSLFSTVFTDFHLFRRLYGLYDVSQAEIDRNLALIELQDKTGVVDSEFETLDLSGGQRKRLSLLVSLLEDRPIVVFDEVAADQDPNFRRKFYKELLPLLKSQGKTIVAVTHDDKYFDEADRLLKMDEGRLVGHELV